MTTLNQTLTDVPGIQVGHATDTEAATGCTVIICPPGTVGGVDVRGGAPGSRETDLLRPENNVEEVTAVVLSGGSAFGLATADGIMRYLRENEMGYKTGAGFVVPIVPAAILFDLMIGKTGVYPGAEMGYQAAQTASPEPVEQGTVGAGTGALIGAAMGKEFATKGGLGSASMDLGDGLIVAALVAVNAVGDVINEDGSILAGLRQPPQGDQFVGTLNALRARARLNPDDMPNTREGGENTVIGVVATNARLSKAHTGKIAQMAHDGIARAVNPAHTMYDGDTIFALSTGDIPADTTAIGAYAALMMEQAIRNAVRAATGLDGVRAWNE